MGHLLELLRRPARQAVLLLAIFLLASTALFVAIRAVPGDPVALRLKNPEPARVAAERARLGLDQPVTVQWWLYVRSFATGDWGRSFLTGRRVSDDVAEFLPATIELSLAGLALGLGIGVAAAVGAAVLRLGALRRLSYLLGTTGITVPIFWVGLLELIVFSLWWQAFPSGGRFDFAVIAPPARTGFATIDAVLALDGAALLSALHHLALPALCLSLYPAAQVCAVLQARLQDPRLRTLQTALRARGFGPARIWLRHLLRVVSAPVVTAVGSSFGTLLGGAVLTETVFSWPGIGRYLVGAVIDRDLYAVQNVLLLVVLLVVAVIFAADLLAHGINPQAWRGERSGSAGAEDDR